VSRTTRKNRTLVGLLAIVLTMGVLVWGFVPYYDWIGRAGGYGGSIGAASSGSEIVLERSIKVRFETSLGRKANGPKMPLDFKPVQRQIELRIGETGLAYVEVFNPTDRVVASTTSFNVAPFSAGRFFKTIDCFCFEPQVLAPGERKLLPVSFFVDPEIVDDREASYIKSITLAFTLYETELPQGEVSLSNRPANPLN
jgi:cytochrome c oxidase assembly protein subunit 11